VANLPYWRLSAFYFFLFSVLGSFVPYWSLYLKELGFSAAEIGQVLAIFMLMKVVSPNLWGWLADHSGRRIELTRWLAVFSTFGFCAIFIVGYLIYRQKRIAYVLAIILFAFMMISFRVQ